AAIETVERQVSSLHRWVERDLDNYEKEPLRPYIEALTTVKDQDLERDGAGKVVIRQGVARGSTHLDRRRPDAPRSQESLEAFRWLQGARRSRSRRARHRRLCGHACQPSGG